MEVERKVAAMIAISDVVGVGQSVDEQQRNQEIRVTDVKDTFHVLVAA